MATKKYTITNLIASMPETNKVDVKLEGDCFKDVTLQVRSTLSLEDAMKFVKDVTATCIDDEKADYMPELFDFALRLYIVMYYANVDLTKDVKKAYRILYDTTLFKQVLPHVSNDQLSNLIIASEKRIEHWRNILASSVAGKVSDMMSKMEEMMNGSAEMMQTLDSDDFKEAISRLTESGVIKEMDANKPVVLNDSITESITPNDVAMAAELMSGLTNQSKSEDGSNVVYMKKKK